MKKKKKPKDYSKVDIENIKNKYKYKSIKKKNSSLKLTREIPSIKDRKKLVKYTDSLHNDQRNTVVIVNGEVFDLVKSDLSSQELLNMDPLVCPHVRHLNFIPIRTLLEQDMKNNNTKVIYDLWKIGKLDSDTSVESKAKNITKSLTKGVKVDKVIDELLNLKKSTKDVNALRKIRIKLRKLDYKRYTK